MRCQNVLPKFKRLGEDKGRAMGFGKQQAVARISGDRLAAVTGGASISAEPDMAASKPMMRRESVEPDLSKMRKNRIEETPEQRKKRLAAKTVNFGATFLVRSIIIGAAVYFGYQTFESTGSFPRGVGIGIFVMVGDFGRVLLKAMEPGSK